MAQIKKLQIDDETLYPVTIPQAVVDPDTNKTAREELDEKVDKVTGKQLSTEDYTTAEKSKVTNLPLNTTSELNLKFDKANLESARSQSTTKAPTSKLVDDEFIKIKQDDVNNSYVSTGKNKFNSSNVGIELNKAINTSTGSIITLSGWAISGFDVVKPNTQYIETSNVANVSWGCIFYDINKNYISFVANIGSKVFTTPTNCYYKRSTIRDAESDSINNIQLEEGNTATDFEAYYEELNYNETPMEILYKRDISLTRSQDANKVPSLKLFNDSLLPVDRLSDVNFMQTEYGRVTDVGDALSGMVTVGSPVVLESKLTEITFRTAVSRTIYLAVVDGETFAIKQIISFASTTAINDISSYNLIIGAGDFLAIRATGIKYDTYGSYQTYYTGTNPPIVGTVLTPFSTFMLSYDFKYKLETSIIDNQESRISLLENKTSNIVDSGVYSAIGDSISYGAGSTGGATSWVNYLNTKLGTTLEKRAANGASIWNNMRAQIQGASSSAKLITIMMGVNDMTPIVNGTTVLGNIVDVLNIANDEPINYASSTLFNHSVLGRYRWCLEWAIVNRPDAKIVVLTPIHYAGGDQTVLENIRNGENAIADFLGLQAVKLTDKSLFSATNFAQYLADGLHPNDLGYKIIAGDILHSISLK